MSGVTYALADFVTGGPILDLPVMEGASWSAQLNRPDAVQCTIDLKDEDARSLDLRSASEPTKTILLARNDDDVVLAWGLVKPRAWDETTMTLTLTATGVRSSYFGRAIIAPVAARTSELVIDGAVNPALDTTLTGWSLGTIGKKLVAQRLAWPGATTMPFDLPADEVGTHERTYAFAALKSIGSALDDLADVENGPDFAFDAQRASDGLSLRYVMRHGSEATPRIGVHAGTWSLGGQSPLTDVKIDDNSDDMAVAGWMSAGKQAGEVLLSRVLNDDLVTASGYPPLDLVDTSHNDVSVQATLDAYNRENLAYAARPDRTITFNVRGDATPGLGQYRPGDTVTIGVPDGHPYLTTSFDIRITSMSGDETGKSIKIGCVILDA